MVLHLGKWLRIRITSHRLLPYGPSVDERRHSLNKNHCSDFSTGEHLPISLSLFVLRAKQASWKSFSMSLSTSFKDTTTAKSGVHSTLRSNALQQGSDHLWSIFPVNASIPATHLEVETASEAAKLRNYAKNQNLKSMGRYEPVNLTYFSMQSKTDLCIYYYLAVALLLRNDVRAAKSLSH